MYIARAERNHVIAAPLVVGSTLPSHCTSMGRILLSALSADLREEWLSHTVLEPRTERTIVSADALRAELDIVAEQSWNLTSEERRVGIACVSTSSYRLSPCD